MPDIRQQSTVEALARAFTSNGRKQEQAMIDIDYSPNYARKYCGHMWANPRLKAAIARIDTVQAQIGNRTVKDLDGMYQAGFDIAKTQKNSTGMATNTTGIARLYGMDKDSAQSGTDKPADLTPEQRRAAIAASKAVTGPKLHKEAV